MLKTIRLKSKYLDQMSSDDFFEFCMAHQDLRIERSVNGEIFIISPTGSLSRRYSAEILRQLANWNISKKLGEVFDSSAGFTLPDKSVKSPDASWISHEKWSKIDIREQQKFAPVCPEFVVEVLSPSGSLKELRAKMEEWIANGCLLAWLIIPHESLSIIYKADKTAREVKGFEGKLSGEEVLPGFELDLSLIK